MNTTSTDVRTMDEPIVPKLSPPVSAGFVRKSPNVAPNGRVRTKAIQNSMTRSSRVPYAATTTRPSSPPMRAAPPANPRPESSARKSPRAVPSVFEHRIATQ
jgi:hypothetical protein